MFYTKHRNQRRKDASGNWHVYRNAARMILSYLLITFRSMMKNKVFIITNVFGMGIALSISIVTFLAYQYDQNFDAVHTNKSDIYRVGSVRQFENKLTHSGYAPYPLGEIVDRTFQEVDLSSPYLNSGSNFKRNNDLFAANLSYVSPEFFQMFSFDFIAGNAAAFSKTDVLISESVAHRLFATPEEAVGKMITQVYGKELKEVKIAGVFREPPMNSSFFKRNGSAYMHEENFRDEYKQVSPDDWKATTTLFIQVKQPGRLASVSKQLQSFKANNNNVREDFQIAEFTLDSFASLAHTDRDKNIQSATWSAPPLAAIIGSVIMSTMILLIACFNLTNTAIAISSSRLKEIGIRKVMGSMRIQLIVQFLGETTVICFLALAVGLAMSDLMIEGWNLMTNNNIHLESNYLETPGFLFFLVGILFLTAIVAGSYPALYISKFKPISILKGKLKFGGTNYFTRTLLGLQFAISLIAIVSAIAFMQNSKYQKNYDLGFDIRGAVVASINDETEFETYRNALASNPQVISIAGAKTGIFSHRLHEPVKYQSAQAEVDVVEVGAEYVKTMDLKIVAGRDFIKDSKSDVRESVIITQMMADLFRWENALGKEVIWRDSIKLYVVGVVKNVYTQGLWREMEPLMIRYVEPTEYRQLIVSARAENVSAVNDSMSKEWSRIFPNRLYPGYMLGQSLQEVSALNQGIMYGYGFLGLIAMILSATGLYSLLSLNIIKRMKEIGIRKIVGASVFSITRVVNTEFVIILTVASVLGSVASYNWCSIIMQSIWKYYQGVNLWTFVIAITLLFTVSILTIAQKLYSVATMNAIDTLRDE
jgi:putative ABC transport system permease protein